MKDNTIETEVKYAHVHNRRIRVVMVPVKVITIRQSHQTQPQHVMQHIGATGHDVEIASRKDGEVEFEQDGIITISERGAPAGKPAMTSPWTVSEDSVEGNARVDVGMLNWRGIRRSGTNGAPPFCFSMHSD